MDIHPKVQAALREVREKGLKDGCEHMVVLEPKTLEVAGRSDGDRMAVSMPMQCRDDSVPWVIVHNHPGLPASLSLQDLCCAASFGGTVSCVTDDGMVYAAKPKGVGPEQLWNYGLVHGHCTQGWERQHEGNLRLAQMGLIEYEWGKLEEASNG